MNHSFVTIGRPLGWLITLLIGLSEPTTSTAHPMPNSAVLLTVHADRIDAELQIPLIELQAAWGHAVNDSAGGLVNRLGPQLRAYFSTHIRPQSPDGRFWQVAVGELTVHETRNPINGVYRELMAQVRMVPPAGEDVRQFTLYYDAVLHQVVTHKILVSVRQDWARGQLAGAGPVQVGSISLDIVNNRILPLVVSLESGSVWSGFVSMVKLGTQHIAEGTDHLLFLLMLLLPAPLLVTGGAVPHRRTGRPGTGQFGWGPFGGVRHGLIRLLRIVTAFTIGHSLTLLIGSLAVRHSDWLRLLAHPVEILIAVSILVSAVHAIRPLFPGRETWVAAGFGLVHGLAFAGTLVNLRLDVGPMTLSILGFNLGIELMQLVVVGLTIPWLILLSRTPIYGYVRVGGALLAAIAATAWMMERLTGQPNAITHLLESERTRAIWLLVALALVALWSSWQFRPAARSSVPIA